MYTLHLLLLSTPDIDKDMCFKRVRSKIYTLYLGMQVNVPQVPSHVRLKTNSTIKANITFTHVLTNLEQLSATSVRLTARSTS